ncbi:MAG TPA: SDR family oxidoreductase [Thermoplasmata archaeon]|nr:SDR family oxidoreductase [Thermoplasmata archaeon]
MTARRRADAPRVALITGASRGLGSTIARFLAGQGYSVIANARTAGPLRREAAQLLAVGGRPIEVAGDVARADVRRRLRLAAERLGRLDLLVNNASELGPSPLPPLARFPLRALERIYRTNVVAPVALVQELRPLLARSRGRIVNISSDAAVGGYPGWGGYGASKAALDLVSRTLAHELAEDGISVVSVDPGDMRTAMHQAAYPGESIADRPLPEVTVPFWAWLLGQDPRRVSGHRFRAQAETWEVPA